MNYIQENESVSDYGVFRGMHFQKGEYSQSKLIRVINGEVLDIIYDLRKSSSSFGKYLSINLLPGNILFVPKGVAHGFLSLKSNTILNYKCDNFYNPESESGFNIFKSNLNLGLQDYQVIISDKDKSLPSLKDCYTFD